MTSIVCGPTVFFKVEIVLYAYIYNDDLNISGIRSCCLFGYRIFRAQTFALRKWIQIARRFFGFYISNTFFAAKICPSPVDFGLETRSIGGGVYFIRGRSYYFFIRRVSRLCMLAHPFKSENISYIIILCTYRPPSHMYTLYATLQVS